MYRVPGNDIKTSARLNIDQRDGRLSSKSRLSVFIFHFFPVLQFVWRDAVLRCHAPKSQDTKGLLCTYQNFREQSPNDPLNQKHFYVTECSFNS